MDHDDDGWFKIKAMFTAPGMRYSVPYRSALRLASSTEEGGLTRRAAQDLIYNLQLHGWFVAIYDQTRLSLAPRALLELRESLSSEFDVRTCIECGELVVSGATCGNTLDGMPFPEEEEEKEQEKEDVQACTFAFHARCSKAALSAHIRAERSRGQLGPHDQGPHSCPQCKGEWVPIVVGEGGTEGADEVGEQSAGSSDSDSDSGVNHGPLEPRATRTTQGKRAHASSLIKDQASDEDDDEDDGDEEGEEEEEEVVVQPRQTRRRYN